MIELELWNVGSVRLWRLKSSRDVAVPGHLIE